MGFDANTPRFKIPVERIDPEMTVISYVIDEQRVSLPFTAENRQLAANLWTADMINEWFAKDHSKIFFYVPQIAAYQGKIEVTAADYEAGE